MPHTALSITPFTVWGTHSPQLRRGNGRIRRTSLSLRLKSGPEPDDRLQSQRYWSQRPKPEAQKEGESETLKEPVLPCPEPYSPLSLNSGTGNQPEGMQWCDMGMSRFIPFEVYCSSDRMGNLNLEAFKTSLLVWLPWSKLLTWSSPGFCSFTLLVFAWATESPKSCRTSYIGVI